MKRIFVFAVLATAFAVPVSMVQAQGGNVAPQQNVQAPGQNPLANAAPNEADVVQSGAARGALGGLASGAPGISGNVQGGAAAAVAPQAGVAQGAPVAGAPAAGAPAAAAPVAGAPAAGGVAGQAIVGQQGVAGQAVVGQGGVAGQAVAGGAAVGGAAIAGQAGVVGQAGIVAGGQTVVGVQQSIMSRMQQQFLVAQAFQHCMFFSDFQPHVINPQALPVGGFAGPFFAPVPGDLQIMSVGMVADGGAAGPIYRVTFKNNGPVAARFFRVSLIATLGQLTPTSPVVSVNIPEVLAGAVGTVDIQLPIGVMTLAQSGPFSQMIAVVDSFSEVMEVNKLNNVLTLNRADVILIETAAVAPAAGAAVAPVAGAAAAVAPVGGAAAGVAPAAAGIAAPGAAAGVAPGAAAAPVTGGPAAGAPAAGAAPAAPVAPQQGRTDLDKIDLDSVSGASEILNR
jgi:hypothetical protein